MKLFNELKELLRARGCLGVGFMNFFDSGRLQTKRDFRR
jgi:hypothetical protein